MNESIFISAPISGFENNNDYLIYRHKVLNLIYFLRSNNYDVFSEIENIVNTCDYDSPSKSVEIDFKKISNTQFFILVHPLRIQTSSLIELGYAFALEKRIIIIGSKENLPYLAIGITDYSDNANLIDVDNIGDDDYLKVLHLLK